MTMPTKATRDEPKPTPRALRPKDAATLVIVDDRGGAARVLMGKRRDDLVFMPGKYVFPGGRVDRCDRGQTAADSLTPDVEALLLQRMKGRPSTARARGLALAAVREVFEETGVVIGRATRGADAQAPRAVSGRAADAWAAFVASGHVPSIAPLTLLARAITPPGRPRRYDTRFFLAPAGSIATTLPQRDDELSHVDWFTIDEMRRLDLPIITRAIVEDLALRLQPAGRSDGRAEMPFYYFQAGTFRRQLIDRQGLVGEAVIWRR